MTSDDVGRRQKYCRIIGFHSFGSRISHEAKVPIGIGVRDISSTQQTSDTWKLQHTFDETRYDQTDTAMVNQTQLLILTRMDETATT
jgi:hypothetical protein